MKLWDEIFSEIRSYFGNPHKCTEGNNIVMKVDGSVSFELIKRAAEEKNARTSQQLSDLAEKGEHPWQQPEFIDAHSKRTSKQLSDLAEKGEHPWQQPEFIERTSKRMRDLVARGEHLFQQPEFIEENSKQTRALVDIGEHLFQQPEFKEDKKKWWDEEENKLEFGVKKRKVIHVKRKLSSGSTEEATYYAFDGADENGRYILIPEIFGTNDLNF